MIQKNGYFKIDWKGTEGVCTIFPAVEDGIPLNLKELTSFLDVHGFAEYDVKELKRIIDSNCGGTCSVGQGDGIAFSETIDIKISLDRMKATCRFFPGTKGANLINAKDILAALQQNGINYGVDQDAVMDFLGKRCYCTDYVMAVGTPVVHGRDARIEYFFNTNPSMKPKHNEDGSVDYRDLNMICHVGKGDLLAKLHPEDRGKPGKDITGREIPPRAVKTKRLEFGNHIRLAENATELYSEVTGHVSLVNDKVFVSDVYEVPADVDNSTGNIEYDGNVVIKGSVRGGFSVYAKGDIIIEGVVEDALIQSDKQVIIKCGIHGMQKGVVEAQGNVITKFIENAKVFSGGYIETGSIIGSDVSAAEDIIVAEQKGFISGGVIRAGGKVEAQNIGSPMGAITSIEVGIAPEKKEKYMLLQKEIASLNSNVTKITPILKSYSEVIKSGKQLDAKNLSYYKQLTQKLNQDQDEMKELEQEFHKLHQEMVASKHAKVIVKKDIHSGVTITISDISHVLKEKRSYCSFEKKDGEIIVSNL